MEGPDDPQAFSPSGDDRDRTLACLSQLEEDTMVAAWGFRTFEERRRIVQAAVILGRKLEERLSQRKEELHPDEAQRFLMSLINDTVAEFARQEDLDSGAATDFLSNVGNRDLILEFNEVLESADETGQPLDDRLRRIVEARKDRAIWSDHWSSG